MIDAISSVSYGHPVGLGKIDKLRSSVFVDEEKDSDVSNFFTFSVHLEELRTNSSK
jgi:hypothetical protein